MLERKFTIGEWYVDGFDLTSVITKTDQKNFKHIVKCNYGYANPGAHFEENAANAKLIAAAPDLFYALGAILDTLDGRVDPDNIPLFNEIEDGIRALKKATS